MDEVPIVTVKSTTPIHKTIYSHVLQHVTIQVHGTIYVKSYSTPTHTPKCYIYNAIQIMEAKDWNACHSGMESLTTYSQDSSKVLESKQTCKTQSTPHSHDGSCNS
ncbi:hypothetical protein LOAG_14894 [Loa loa]|uniref:Uncharacterized protein n=1 Tax=Loa loa TaxID=7209 RepID=A0A1S0THC6_LOALO|nr:hypothetical protein LOAG_14894 [Loa loa]EFO13634.1 hypothetical protein LOAG_14894 [Loa loa]